MRDYKAPWDRNRLDDLEIRDSNPIATLASVVLLVLLVAWMLHALVEAVEVETLQQYGVAERPQAYRKQPPTHEQMWAMDHLLAVQEVAKAGGKQ